jgi:hypothetical protein
MRASLNRIVLACFLVQLFTSCAESCTHCLPMSTRATGPSPVEVERHAGCCHHRQSLPVSDSHSGNDRESDGQGEHAPHPLCVASHLVFAVPPQAVAPQFHEYAPNSSRATLPLNLPLLAESTCRAELSPHAATALRERAMLCVWNL